jgi:hemolysin activation/secretion protein
MIFIILKQMARDMLSSSDNIGVGGPGMVGTLK